MANTLKFGGGVWATKKGSTLAYNDENDRFKPLPFTTTRASSATRVNKEGLIEVVENDRPRIDYTDSADGALLLEPQRSNLNTYSDPKDSQKGSTSYASVTYQDNYSWGLGNVINNAIVFGDNSTTRYAYYNSTISSGTEYTLSAFIKMDDNSVPIPATDFLMVLAGVSFASGYNVESYGNNIYRVSVSGTAGASNTANGILKIASNSIKGFTISGFQLEQGSYATSYIPTSGSAVTRIADVCNNGGNDQVINSTEGVLYAEISGLSDDSTNRYISLSDGSTSNRVNIFFDSSNNLRGFYTGLSGSITINTDITLTNKIAFKYKSGDSSFWLNGFEVATRTDALSLSGLDSLSFDLGGGSDFYGNAKDLRVYNTALSDSELAALTQV